MVIKNLNFFKCVKEVFYAKFHYVSEKERPKIFLNNSEIILVQDSRNSTPIYYGYINKILYLSDELDFFKDKCIIDFGRLEEYIHFGFVLGSETFFKGIYQVEASQEVKIDLITRHIKKTDNLVFRKPEVAECNFETEIEKLHDRIFCDTFDEIGKKKILLSLSGGYDSRVIACQIAKNKLENKTIAFTYGDINNPEVKVAKRIARNLRIRWIFINLTNIKKHNKINTYETGGHSKSKKYLPYLSSQINLKDYVLLLGDSADFFSGSRLSKYSIYNFKKKKKLIEQFLDFNSIRYKNSLSLKQKIYKEIYLNKQKYQLDNYSVLEYLDWRNRQAKLITMNVSVLKDVNLTKLNPFFQTKYIRFWNSVPNCLRNNQRLYKCYAEQLFDRFNVNFKSSSAELTFPNNLIFKMVNKLPRNMKYFIYRTKDILRYFFQDMENKDRHNEEYSCSRKLFSQKLSKLGYGKKGKNYKALLIDKSIENLIKSNSMD